MGRRVCCIAAMNASDPVDLIDLTPRELDVSVAVAHATDASSGGIAVFLGTTRAEANASKQPLVALDYEAYPEMALEQMRDLADDVMPEEAREGEDVQR